MVFQSWTGGNGWAIVKPSEVIPQEDGSNIAKFTYDDIVSSYGTDVQLLNRLYLSTTTSSITLHSFDFYLTVNTGVPEIEFINIGGQSSVITMPVFIRMCIADRLI